MDNSAALAGVAVALAVLVVALARLAGALEEAEVALRGLVTAVRGLRRGVRRAVTLAGDVGRDVTAGEEGLDGLARLKAPGRPGSARPASGTLAATDGEPAGPVSLVIRPHPDPAGTGKRGGGAAGGK